MNFYDFADSLDTFKSARAHNLIYWVLNLITWITTCIVDLVVVSLGFCSGFALH